MYRSWSPTFGNICFPELCIIIAKLIPSLKIKYQLKFKMKPRLLLEVFKSQLQFQYLWLDCLYFLFLPGSVLGECTFLRICPFLQGCPFYWHIVACSSLLYSFVFLWCLLYFSFFVSNFIDLSALPLFLDDSG